MLKPWPVWSFGMEHHPPQALADRRNAIDASDASGEAEHQGAAERALKKYLRFEPSDPSESRTKPADLGGMPLPGLSENGPRAIGAAS
jgi:hypothetical protein